MVHIQRGALELRSAFIADAAALGAGDVWSRRKDFGSPSADSWLRAGPRACIVSAASRDADLPELILQSTLVKGHTHADVVEMLLGAGADANLRDSLGGSALLGAAQAGHGAVIDTLTARGATCAPSVRSRVKKRVWKNPCCLPPGQRTERVTLPSSTPSPWAAPRTHLEHVCGVRV